MIVDQANGVVEKYKKQLKEKGGQKWDQQAEIDARLAEIREQVKKDMEKSRQEFLAYQKKQEEFKDIAVKEANDQLNVL